MRPRKALIEACPWLSRDQASEELRKSGGNVDKAKHAATAARRQQQTQREGVVDGNGKGSRHDTEQSGAPSSKMPLGNDDSTSNNINPDTATTTNMKHSASLVRNPPRHSASINNLSDRQYCCVWGVEVYEDGYRPDVARTLLATVARHVNPVLRGRGWRVKRLIESASNQWIGLCTTNGRGDADAASTNIQLNLRVRPDKNCKQFRTFQQILAVMLHEITHTSIGLEDIHPPAFYELLDEIKKEYRQKLVAGEVDLETDDYGCNGQFISSSGELASVASSASDILGTNDISNLNLLGKEGSEGDCGASKRRRRRGNWKRKHNTSNAGYTSNVPKKEKKRPLLKGAKMIDKRTKDGKASMADRENLSARDLAARAALARFGSTASSTYSNAKAKAVSTQEMISIDDSSDEEENAYKNGESGDNSDVEEDDEDEIDEPIKDHNTGCGCRSCDWSKLFLLK